MKIVIANPYFPPFAPGGAEHSLEQMCQRFTKQGWYVHVITNCCDGDPRVEERDGYTVNFLPSPIRLSPGQQIDESEYLHSASYYHILTEALISSLHNDFSGCVFVANNAQCFIPVAKAGKIAGVPTIGIVRDTQVICETGTCIDNQSSDDAVPCKGLMGAVKCMLKFNKVRGCGGVRSVPGIILNGVSAGIRRERLRRNGLRALDQTVTISDALQCLVRKLPYINNRKITTIRNFHTNIDRASDDEVETFLEKHGLIYKPYFLVAGKKSYGKGSDLAVKAIEIARQKYPNIGLLFVGKGKVQSSNSISYVDCAPVSQPMLLGLLYHSNALLIPGRWQEGSHRTMIDALYLRTPIICTEAGGAKEGVSHGKNGYIVPCNDVDALSNAMLKLLTWDNVSCSSCGLVSASIFREKFSDEVVLDGWKALLYTDSRK